MSAAPTRDLFPGSLEMMILQTLRREPMHGYALAQTIRQASDDLLQVEEGSLYPALLRMLKAGWVSSEWGVSARNRKVRIYRITRFRAQTTGTRGLGIRTDAGRHRPRDENGTIMKRLLERLRIRRSIAEELNAHLEEKIADLDGERRT